MRRFLVNIAIYINDKKITAIKDFRMVTGCSLLEAKNFCENSHPDERGMFGGHVILNADQLADLMVLTHSEPVTGQPRFWAYGVEEIKNNGIDFSGIIR